MKRQAVESVPRPRVLLVGDPSARPTGLERALTRAGFQLVERKGTVDPDADAILITLNEVDQVSLAGLLPAATPGSPVPPRIVVIAAANPDAPATALALGAADALGAPIHLPELCARLHARIRGRLDPSPATEGEELLPTSQGNGREADGQGETLADAEAAQAALDLRMREEFERARRYSLSFSLVLLGIDELGGVTERLGPAAADQLRADVASALRRELRVPDFVVSYGSNEFAIVLPETGQAGARQSVIRVRERLALVPQEGDPRLEHPRFSAGIVTYPHPAVSQTEELYAMAEAALMRGKAQSGERIGVAV